MKEVEDASYSLRPIGVVRSSLRDVRDAPNQAFEGAPEALLEIDRAFAPALHLVAPGQDLILLSWLHRADRSVLQTHPRGDPSTCGCRKLGFVSEQQKSSYRLAPLLLG